jgi:hypothetical protein
LVNRYSEDLSQWERLSPPASPERLAMAGRQPRSHDLIDFYVFYEFYDFHVHAASYEL